MHEKHWTDQPDEVTGAEVKLSFHADGTAVEVRAMPEPDAADESQRWTQRTFYVTMGNLFGSQTVLAHGADAVLEVLQAALNRKKGSQTALPKGCELLKNAV